MKRTSLLLLLFLFLLACKSKVEKIKPQWRPITESVYASGIIKSRDQYQAYATINGIVDSIFVQEGDTVKSGQAIMRVDNQMQRLNRDNAALAAKFADLGVNQNKVNDIKLQVQLALNKLNLDSSLYQRQKKLWEQQVGTKVDLEQKELAYQNSRTAYNSVSVKAADLVRQVELNAIQSQNNLRISSGIADDYIIKSELNGIVYDLLKSKGEIVGLQTPLAVVGRAGDFILEMQVDEYDIFKIHNGQQVLITMDSYKGEVFEGLVTKIYPIMNERSKSFLVEAKFLKTPPRLFPFISFEASIVIRKKEKALLIPRNCMINDSTLIKVGGDTVVVKTGLKDFEMMEIISGLSENDQVLRPKK